MNTATNVAVICPRECPSGKTDHCLGWLREDGRAQCWHCGRWMPMAEAIGWSSDYEPEPYCGRCDQFGHTADILHAGDES